MKDEVTCFMLYYGRKELAEEAMASFLLQTHPYRRLIIVNTHPDPVWFEKKYPNVEVHNILPTAFKNLNEKYNYALSCIKTKWWAPWDSDDIWLPWHLENLIAHTKNTKSNGTPRKIGHPQSYFMLGKHKTMCIGWQMWGTSIWETFDKDGNRHAKCNPRLIDNCDRQIVFQDWDRYWLDRKKNPISFVFRWHKEAEHRSSKLGTEGYEREKQLREDMNKIKLKDPWHPHWKDNYVEKVEGKTFENIADIQSKRPEAV